MGRLIVALVLLPACGASPVAESTTPASDAPIVNGGNAPTVVTLTAAQRLAIGALLYDTTDGWVNECTGTLVTPRTVITAAHCLVDEDTGADLGPDEVRFAIGDDAAHPTAVANVSQVITHPSYDFEGTTARYDSAVLVLSAPLAGATPLAVNCGSLPASLVGQKVQNVGYGATWDDDYNSKRWWAAEKVKELSSYAITVDGNGDSGVCYGDSGGPILWNLPGAGLRILGTLSIGDEGCALEDDFVRTDSVCSFLAPYLPSTAPEPTPPPATGGCSLEGVDFDADELACALDFIESMSCDACDALFDSRLCEDAINDAAVCQRGPTCTGCDDGDTRADGVDCAELAAYSYFGPAAAQRLHDELPSLGCP